MAPRPSTNAELVQKYRDKSRALSSGRRPSAADKLLRLVLQLLVLTICKGVQTLSVPVGKLFAVYFWLGKNVVTLSLFLEKQLLKAVGWLSGTGFGRDSRLGRLSNHYWGVDLKRWHVGLVALVLGGVVHGVVRTIRNSFDERVKRARWLRRLMTAASTYDEWRAHAARLEQLEGADMRGAVEHEDYDRKLLLEKLRHLKRMRATGNPREQMLALRIDLIRNVANIAKSQAHRQNFVSVPQPIQQYIGEVKGQLELLAAWPEAELPLEEKLSFFRVTRHAYGRTALLLSGGGGLGTFHLGVCKALFEHNLLPRVLAGSSVGSIVCALVGTRTDEELRRTFANLDKFDVGFFQNSTALDLVRYAMNKGHLQDISFMICKLRQLLGDCTFLEAFERTGRILNVTVCPADTNEPPRLLNYMTAPQALVWSAVAASSSFPGLYPPQHLLGRNSHGETIKLHGHGGSDALQRRWRDGSLEFDLPVQTLAEMFNCNHFLVSQTNPHIVPLLNFKAIFPRKWASIMEAELKHRLQVVQWMLPEWQLSKWLTLFTQPWEGDITFTLPSMLWNLRKTIVNPSTLELMHAVQVGEHATWERMASIECNCSIEATLDMCAAKLQHRARGTSMPAIGGKVPSWLHMPQPLYTSGMPPSGRSWGDGIADNEACAAVASWGDFSSMLNGNSSRVHLPPLHRPPLYFSLHQPAFELPEGSEADALEAETTGTSHAGEDPKQQQAHHRLSLAGRSPHLPPIPSSLSSEHDHDHEQDGFDSASSVAAASGGAGTLLQRALSHSRRGAAAAVAGATEGLQSAGSTGISRRSSMMRHLNLMAGPEHEEGVASKGSLLAASTGLPMGAVGGSGSPVPGSNRSSISLPEVQQQVPALPPQQQPQHGPQQGGWVGSFGSPTASTPAATAGSEGLPPRAPPKESLPRHASAPVVHHQVASRPLHGPVSAAGAVSAGASPVKPLMQPPPGASASAMPAHAGGAGASAGQPCPGVMASTITEQQLLELANMDTGGMIDDIWGSLLPLAGTCVSLTSANGQQGGAAGSATGQAGGLGTVSEDSDAIDIFAY